MTEMFTDEILERIFLRKELQKLSIETQSEVIHAIEEVLEEVEEESQYE
jgi:hypothetical protein